MFKKFSDFPCYSFDNWVLIESLPFAKFWKAGKMNYIQTNASIMLKATLITWNIYNKHRHTVYRYAHLFEYRATCLYLLQYALQLVVIDTSIFKVPVIDGSMLLFIYWPPDISSGLINTSILNKISVIDRSMLLFIYWPLDISTLN